MKELSIEEKAKAYDEAIKRAQAKMEEAKVFDYDDEQTAHTIRLTTTDIFPELKESEDEKIRKSLLKYLKDMCKNTSTPFFLDNAKLWIAYLEKQGEHNDDAIIDPELNDYCCKIYNALHKENGGVLSFARLQHLAMDIQKWCKKQQKSVECDESIIDETISLINKLASGYGEKVDEPITFNGVKMINNIKERLRAIKPKLKEEPVSEEQVKGFGIRR